MHRHLFGFVGNLRLRWKMTVMVLPLVIVPILLVGGIVGTVATRQARLGLTQTSKDDLRHMSEFTLDLLNSHYQQFQVYKQDKKASFNKELATVVNLSFNLVQSQANLVRSGAATPEGARQEARRALKRVNVGETGYIYAITSAGDLWASTWSGPFCASSSTTNTADSFQIGLFDKRSMNRPSA